jgi:hypothetical protein
VLYVDEKHRSRDYGDLLLEIFSDFARRTCSWLTGPAEVTTHLAQVTPGMCTVVDFRALRRAWDWHGGRWLEDGWAHSSYRDVEEWIASAGPSGRALIKGRGGCAMVLSSTENRYHTLSVAVSWDRLNADAGIRPLRAAWKIPVDSMRSRV